jgi:methylthioribose-1-phosphate isomerase
MKFKTLSWIGGVDGFLEIIDQRRLPAEYKIIRCVTIKQLYAAIKSLAVRGAPAIGVAGAYGGVISLKNVPAKTLIKQALRILKRDCEYLESSRPTAVNLRWALDRIVNYAERSSVGKLNELRKAVLAEAKAIYDEDVRMCLKIGRNGERFVKNGFSVVTHCNAGFLATAGQGTALSVLYEAKKQGKHFKVYADESRPLLQGARLTAWELKRAGIDVTVICDNMAGALMSQGKIDMVIVGADRIAANGDTANKIGTYSLSVLAKAHKIPFYIAAPSSTFDLKTKTGKAIPIEQRPADEVKVIGKKQLTPDGIKIYNPAFDVTPAENITAIITERGVIEKPNERKIKKHHEKTNDFQFMTCPVQLKRSRIDD